MIARADESDLVRLDLNNAVFQRQLFALEKTQQLGVLATLRKLSELRWPQVYPDRGLKWELIKFWLKDQRHGELVFAKATGQPPTITSGASLPARDVA